MNSLRVDRCLVIPDVHQDIVWVEKILSREKNWDHCVFLGDYFDPKQKQEDVSGIRATARFIREVAEEHGDRISLLWGNHDIPYWEARKRMRLGAHDDFFYDAGVPIRKGRVHDIFKEWDDDFVARLRLFQALNGFLLSHAGVDKSLWPEADTVEESLEVLEQRSKEALLAIARQRHPLLMAGISRGGFAPVGGLTWNCWVGDFTSDLPLPQIVGHTASSAVRQKGRSYCIACVQTRYGVIEGNEFLSRII